MTDDQRVKANIRSKTRMKRYRGKLNRLPCEICGTTEKVEAHHDDYTKPYDVRWLCFNHHREFHYRKWKTDNESKTSF